VDPDNVASACRECHDYVETHRAWAAAAGWLRPARTDEELRRGL